MKKISILFILIMTTNAWSQAVAPHFSNGIDAVTIYGENDDGLVNGSAIVMNHEASNYKLSKQYDGSLHVQATQMALDAVFGAPVNQPLQTIMYNDATRWPFNEDGHPGISLSIQYSGCNKETGKFKILELEVDNAGNTTKLAVDFEHRCEPAFHQGTTYGAIRYHSTIPVVSNTTEFVNGQLTIPVVELRSNNGFPQFKSVTLREVVAGGSQYQVESIQPAIKGSEDAISIPAAYDLEQQRFIIPSVLKQTGNNQYAEYEMRFMDLPYDLKVGDTLTLDEMKLLRN